MVDDVFSCWLDMVYLLYAVLWCEPHTDDVVSFFSPDKKVSWIHLKEINILAPKHPQSADEGRVCQKQQRIVVNSNNNTHNHRTMNNQDPDKQTEDAKQFRGDVLKRFIDIQRVHFGKVDRYKPYTCVEIRIRVSEHHSILWRIMPE